MSHLIRCHPGTFAPAELLQAILIFVLPPVSSLGATPNVQHAGRHENVIVPESSVVHAEDRGLRAHTNHLILARLWRRLGRSDERHG